MVHPDIINDIKLLVRSRHGLLWIETADEKRVKVLTQVIAEQLRLPYFSWTPTRGLRKEGETTEVVGTKNPSVALHTIELYKKPAVYHLKGIDDYFQDTIVVQRLKDLSAKFAEMDGIVIVSTSSLSVPPLLERVSTIFQMPQPTQRDYLNLLKRILRDLRKRSKVKIDLSETQLKRMLDSLKGLTMREADRILTKAILHDSALTSKDIQRVIQAKREVISKEGLLEYYPVESSKIEIADLKTLRSWLDKRKRIITNPKAAKKFGLEFPKGILLLGVQGCGKSLCAKLISKEWGLPLMKLDPSNLYDKYVGQSERNFKKAMRVAEGMAPVILWVDEIEKAFAQGGGGDDGAATSKRILGTFLNWMQEREEDVFIIATANAIDDLPPEFLRKGRFDEIFFVDLPNSQARKAIFQIHLKRRKRKPENYNLSGLVRATEGFSGAEIEQVILSGLYTAFSEGTKLTTEILMDEISQTRPLSRTMAEKIAKLRKWASSRTVSAH